MDYRLSIIQPDDLDFLDLDSDIEEMNKIVPVKNHKYKFEPTPIMGVDYLTPTFIIVTLAGLFFKDFITNINNDLYKLFKSHLKSYINKTRKVKVKTITATASTDKIDQNYTQSKVVSLKIQLGDKQYLNLLFDLDLSEEDWNSGIEQILNFVEHLYENPDKLENARDAFFNESGTVTLVINKDTKIIQIVNHHYFMKKH